MSVDHYPRESYARRSEEQHVQQPGTDPDPGGGRNEFARDRDRILYSSAFRSLAGKSQVVPSTETGQFHTRLTHSLKVAQLGRRIAERLRRQYMDQAQPDHEGESDSATATTAHLIVPPDPDLVEFACLAHDIGHPPFGHAGEQELNAVADELIEQAIHDHYDSPSQPETPTGDRDLTAPEPASADTPIELKERIERAKLLFGGFEGNAQSFRIVTRLANKAYPADTTADGPNTDFFGLDLTYAAMDALTKYPWTRAQGESSSVPHADEGKWGGYGDRSDASSDYSVLCRARAKTGFQQPSADGDDASRPRKSFECQVMDWCDDVTYAVHDVEDFYMAGMLPMAAIFDNTPFLERLRERDPGPDHEAPLRTPNEPTDDGTSDEDHDRRRAWYPETGEWQRFRQKLLDDWCKKHEDGYSDDDLDAEKERLNRVRLHLCHEIYGVTGWFADLDTVQARRFSQRRVSALIDYLAGDNLTYSGTPMLHQGCLKLSRGGQDTAAEPEGQEGTAAQARREVCDLLKKLVRKYVIESPGLRMQQEGQRKILRDLVELLAAKPKLLPARYLDVVQAEAAAAKALSIEEPAETAPEKPRPTSTPSEDLGVGSREVVCA